MGNLKDGALQLKAWPFNSQHCTSNLKDDTFYLKNKAVF